MTTQIETSVAQNTTDEKYQSEVTEHIRQLVEQDHRDDIECDFEFHAVNDHATDDEQSTPLDAGELFGSAWTEATDAKQTDVRPGTCFLGVISEEDEEEAAETDDCTSVQSEVVPEPKRLDERYISGKFANPGCKTIVIDLTNIQEKDDYNVSMNVTADDHETAVDFSSAAMTFLKSRCDAVSALVTIIGIDQITIKKECRHHSCVGTFNCIVREMFYEYPFAERADGADHTDDADHTDE